MGKINIKSQNKLEIKEKKGKEKEKVRIISEKKGKHTC